MAQNNVQDEMQARLCLDSLSARHLAPNGSSVNPWVRFLALLRLERVDLVVLCTYAVVLGGFSLAVPVAVQVLVNTIALGSLLQPLVVLSILLFGVLGFSGLIQVLQAFAVEMLQRRMFLRVAEDFARRLPSLDFEAHDKVHTPELINRFFEVVGLQKSLSRLLVDGLSLFLQIVVGLLLLAFYHPLLLAFDVTLVFAVLVMVALGYGAVDSAVRESRAKYRVAAWLEEIATHPVLFGRHTGKVSAATQADSLIRDYLKERRRHYGTVLRQIVSGVGIQVLAMVGLLGIGGWLVMKGELTLGQLVAAELVVGSIGLGFAKSGKYFESTYDLLASIDKVGVVLDQPLASPSRQLDPEPGPEGSSRPFALEFQGVQLADQGNCFGTVPHAKIKAGSRVLIQGPGGCGKSALLEAAAGLRKPRVGTIRLGEARHEQDNNDDERYLLDPQDYRESLWLCRSRSVVSGTIIDNLRLGNLDLDEAQAWDLLKCVALDKRVAQLEKGLTTRVSPGGYPFSPSEQARLSLARALAARPRLLLIDGALDYLGLEEDSKERVLESILGKEQPWTVLVVSESEAIRQRCENKLSIDTPETSPRESLSPSTPPEENEEEKSNENKQNGKSVHKQPSAKNPSYPAENEGARQ